MGMGTSASSQKTSCTFGLGKRYLILFLEDDVDTHPALFDRDLLSLIHQPGFEHVKGIVIGRFEIASKISRDLLSQIISTKRELANIPVIANVDFGHTNPQITFPIGGSARIEVSDLGSKILIENH